MELPIPMSGGPVPSHRQSAPYGGEGVTLWSKSPIAQAVDTILSDPAYAAELRSRGALPRPAPRRFGRPWKAKKDGECMKALGWIFDEIGTLVDRECGAPIKAGDTVWQQDGYKYYGRGCHGKNIIRLSKTFIERELLVSRDLVDNQPDRILALDMAQTLWQQECEAGNLIGDYGTEDFNRSRERLEAAIKTHLMQRKLIGWAIQVPPRKRPTSVAAPIPIEDDDASAVTTPVAPRLSDVVKRFKGKERDGAQAYANIDNRLRKRVGSAPVTVRKEGKELVVVINPGGSYDPIVTPPPKNNKRKVKA